MKIGIAMRSSATTSDKDNQVAKKLVDKIWEEDVFNKERAFKKLRGSSFSNPLKNATEIYNFISAQQKPFPQTNDSKSWIEDLGQRYKYAYALHFLYYKIVPLVKENNPRYIMANLILHKLYMCSKLSIEKVAKYFEEADSIDGSQEIISIANGIIGLHIQIMPEIETLSLEIFKKEFPIDLKSVKNDFLNEKHNFFVNISCSIVLYKFMYRTEQNTRSAQLLKQMKLDLNRIRRDLLPKIPEEYKESIVAKFENDCNKINALESGLESAKRKGAFLKKANRIAKEIIKLAKDATSDWAYIREQFNEDGIVDRVVGSIVCYQTAEFSRILDDISTEELESVAHKNLLQDALREVNIACFVKDKLLQNIDIDEKSITEINGYQWIIVSRTYNELLDFYKRNPVSFTEDIDLSQETGRIFQIIDAISPAYQELIYGMLAERERPAWKTAFLLDFLKNPDTLTLPIKVHILHFEYLFLKRESDAGERCLAEARQSLRRFERRVMPCLDDATFNSINLKERVHKNINHAKAIQHERELALRAERKFYPKLIHPQSLLLIASAVRQTLYKSSDFVPYGDSAEAIEHQDFLKSYMEAELDLIYEFLVEELPQPLDVDTDESHTIKLINRGFFALNHIYPLCVSDDSNVGINYQKLVLMLWDKLSEDYASLSFKVYRDKLYPQYEVVINNIMDPLIEDNLKYFLSPVESELAWGQCCFEIGDIQAAEQSLVLARARREKIKINAKELDSRIAIFAEKVAAQSRLQHAIEASSLVVNSDANIRKMSNQIVYQKARLALPAEIPGTVAVIEKIQLLQTQVMQGEFDCVLLLNETEQYLLKVGKGYIFNAKVMLEALLLCKAWKMYFSAGKGNAKIIGAFNAYLSFLHDNVAPAEDIHRKLKKILLSQPWLKKPWQVDTLLALYHYLLDTKEARLAFSESIVLEPGANIAVQCFIALLNKEEDTVFPSDLWLGLCAAPQPKMLMNMFAAYHSSNPIVQEFIAAMLVCAQNLQAHAEFFEANFLLKQCTLLTGDALISQLQECEQQAQDFTKTVAQFASVLQAPPVPMQEDDREVRLPDETLPICERIKQPGVLALFSRTMISRKEEWLRFFKTPAANQELEVLRGAIYAYNRQYKPVVPPKHRLMPKFATRMKRVKIARLDRVFHPKYVRRYTVKKQPASKPPMKYIDVPWEINALMSKLTARGFKAYIVGGYVRDKLRSKKARPDDCDITTDCPRELIPEILGESWRVSERVFSKRININTRMLKVQIDCGFTGSIETDSLRRDVEDNAIYCDKDGNLVTDDTPLISPFLEPIGDPNITFKEDPVKMLRYIRDLLRSGKRATTPALHALDMHAHLLAELPFAYFHFQLTKVFKTGKIVDVLKWLRYLVPGVTAHYEKFDMQSPVMQFVYAQLQSKHFEFNDTNISGLLILPEIVKNCESSQDYSQAKIDTLIDAFANSFKDADTPDATAKKYQLKAMVPHYLKMAFISHLTRRLPLSEREAFRQYFIGAYKAITLDLPALKNRLSQFTLSRCNRIKHSRFDILRCLQSPLDTAKVYAPVFQNRRKQPSVDSLSEKLGRISLLP